MTTTQTLRCCRCVAVPFQQKGRPNQSADQERIASLVKKIETKDEVLFELMTEHWPPKKRLGNFDPFWVPHDARGQIVDFVWRWSKKTEIGVGRFIEWLDVAVSKFFDWRERYGRVS